MYTCPPSLSRSRRSALRTGALTTTLPNRTQLIFFSKKCSVGVKPHGADDVLKNSVKPAEQTNIHRPPSAVQSIGRPPDRVRFTSGRPCDPSARSPRLAFLFAFVRACVPGAPYPKFGVRACVRVCPVRACACGGVCVWVCARCVGVNSGQCAPGPAVAQ